MQRLVCGLMAVWLVCSAAAVSALEPDWRPRSVERFAQDAEVVDGAWLEGIGGYVSGGTVASTAVDPITDSDTTRIADVDDIGIAAVRLAAGWKFLEMGLTVPVYWIEGSDVAVEGADDIRGEKEKGIGDAAFYAKVVPIQTSFFNLGGGVLLSAPTGDSDKGLGAGELGFQPFVTASLQHQWFQLRGHAGYHTYRDTNDVAAEGPLYGVGLFFTPNYYLGVRAELIGERYDRPGPSAPWRFEPGIDIRFLFPEVDMILRPTGMIGLNKAAPDWGILTSLVFTRSVYWD
ncbi:MAG TPA: hypothetical protein VEB21_06970 [Terriglobales bacterium]|nr:hypothetical protein [Terriglobales bacterium]